MSAIEITASIPRLGPPRPRRLTRLLTTLLPARSAPPAPAAAPDAAPLELAERPVAREIISAIVEHTANSDWLAGIADLPADLAPAPGRIVRGAQLDAAGFADRASASVGVDVARWNCPPGANVDDHAWRRVFTWIVVADRELVKVAVLSPPAARGAGVSAGYGYEAEGVPGVGVLHVAALPDGRWRIVDCWGDASEAARVHELAAALA